MATLTYWVARQHADSACYNLVARTKKELLLRIAENPSTKYEAPIKETVTYKDAFDLFEWVTGEGGGR